MSLSTSIVMALVLANGVEVRSSSDCPSSDTIAAKLELLLAGGSSGDVAWVDVTGQEPDGNTELRLRLVRADASIVGDRRLVLRGGCDEMADTVATVLAAWQAPPAVAMTTTAAPQAKPAPATAALQSWLGAAAGVALVDGIAASVSLELVAGRAVSPLRARVAAVTQTRRQLDLNPGSVSWRRTQAELGLGWQAVVAGSPWQGGADAGVLLGWLRASGQDFFLNQHEDAFEYGLGAGLRGGRKLGAWALWLEARVDGWTRRQRAVLAQSDAVAWLPRLDVRVNLGLSRLLVR